MTSENDPQLQNTVEIAVMLEALGGTAEVLTWATPAALAEQFMVLQQRLSTHIIVIGGGYRCLIPRRLRMTLRKKPPI
jgi:hypothetical protein